MHPVPGEGPAERDGLGALVLVVRELEIETAGVQIEVVAEQVERHHHALGVPPGPPWPPRRRPFGLAGLGLLPEGEVERRPLLLRHLHPCARPQVVERLLGEQAVAVDRLDGEVDAVGRLVGVAAAHELLHGGGPAHAEPVHRVVPRRLVLRGHLGRAATLLRGPPDDLVVDVGDVGDVAHLEARPLEIAPQHVVHEGGVAVADVRDVVDRQPADVHRHLSCVAQRQLDDVSLRSVVQTEHAGTVTGR